MARSTAPVYQIVDEPQGSPLADFVVNPFWIVLASMLGGAWLGIPWFIFNSVALGSRTRTKEIALAVTAAVGSVVLFLALVLGSSVLGAPKGVGPYLALVVTVWKLGFAYALQQIQGPSFGLHEYFGGRVRNGLPVVLLAVVVGRRLVLSVSDSLLWIVLVA